MSPGPVMFHVSSHCGRIGPFRWVNADTTPQERYMGTGRGVYTVRLGSCGFGHKERIYHEIVKPWGYA